MKSKKTIESFIGKMIFGSLMALPLLSILCRSLYVVCNKNAYQSYSASERITTFIDIEDELYVNKNYHFDSDSLTLSTSANQTITTYSNSVITTLNGIVVPENKLIDFRLMRTSSNYLYVRYFNNDNTEVLSGYLSFSENNFISFDFEVSSNFTLESIYVPFIKEINTNVDNYLDNVWEYSLNQMQESPYYNWVENTATYTVIHNTTNAIQINMPVLDLLLTYWLMITLIYIIFDIVYVMLMLAHDKIHGLIEK